MTGFESSIREGPMGPSPSSVTRLPRPSATAFRSAPAQNVPLAPVRTPTASDSSASKRRKASASASAVGRSTAFRTSGRSMVTTTTGPSCSKRTVCMAPLPSLQSLLCETDGEEGRAADVVAVDREAYLVPSRTRDAQGGQGGSEDALEATAHLAGRPGLEPAGHLHAKIAVGVGDGEADGVRARRVEREAGEDTERRQRLREVGDVEGVEEPDERVLVAHLEADVVAQRAEEQLGHQITLSWRSSSSSAAVRPSRPRYTSSLCSPSRGAPRWIAPGVREKRG